jgi:hypothetical protein
LKSCPSDSAWNNLGLKFKESFDPFAGLKSNYQQTEYIRKLGAYVAPVEYTLSKTQIYVTQRHGQFIKPRLQNVKAQFILSCILWVGKRMFFHLFVVQ